MKRREFIKSCVICASAIPLIGCHKEVEHLQGDYSKEDFLLHTEIHLVEHCNLNCKYCGHFSCIAEEEYYKLKIYKKDIKRLAKVTNSNIKNIRLLGGEPLLHPQIEEIFDITRANFPNSRIELSTNGTLLDGMKPSFWECMNKNNIYLVPTIYPIKINWESILKKAELYNVKVTKNYHDNSTPITINNIEANTVRKFLKLQLDTKGKQEIDKPCLTRYYCANFSHGRLYPCFAVAYVKHFNKKFGTKLPITKKDYVDIYKVDNILEIIPVLKNPFPFCKYCNGYDFEGGEKWEPSSTHTIDEWTM